NPSSLRAALLTLERGSSMTMEQAIKVLDEAGYDRNTQVSTRGQFAVRGGILDLFSWQSGRPVRIEFFGDDIESLREFDIDTQTSIRNLNRIEILLGAAEDQSATVRSYIRSDHLQIGIETESEADADIL